MTARTAVFDALLAASVFAFGQAEVWATSGGAASLVGPRWANATAYGVAALLLLARRQRPLTVLLAQCVVLTIEVIAFGASESLGGLVPVLIGVYSVAAYGSRRSALLGLATAAVLAVAHTVTDPALDDPAQVVGAASFWLLIPLAWLLGQYTRTRRLYVGELADRARRAEHEQQEQTRRAIATERARIARDLHDVIAHGVGVMVRQAEAGEVRLDTDPERARGSLVAIAETGRQALAEVRRLVALLRTDDPEDAEELTPQPDLGSLDELFARVRDAGLEVTERRDADPRLPAGLQLVAFRLVQEALTNTLRHANATHADVAVHCENDTLVAEVTDNGTGGPEALAAGLAGTGHGLVGMRERVALYGGDLVVGPRADGGFAIRARIPLPGDRR
jgi:signal transduction histidine kinase